MTEQFANVVANVLTSATGVSDTSLSVSNGAGLPATGTFRVLIDNEIILANGRSGNTITPCVRGQEGTVSSAHPIGATVKPVLTSGAIAQFKADVTGSLLAGAANTQILYDSAGVITGDPALYVGFANGLRSMSCGLAGVVNTSILPSSYNFGDAGSASGQAACAIGYSQICSNSFSTAVGNLSTSSQAGTCALGEEVTATAANSCALGFGAASTGNTSVALGRATDASGDFSTVRGFGSGAHRTCEDGWGCGFFGTGGNGAVQEKHWLGLFAEVNGSPVTATDRNGLPFLLQTTSVAYLTATITACTRASGAKIACETHVLKTTTFSLTTSLLRDTVIDGTGELTTAGWSVTISAPGGGSSELRFVCSRGATSDHVYFAIVLEWTDIGNL